MLVDRPTALFRSHHFLGHDTGEHPENPGRIVAIDDELQRQGLIAGRPTPSFEAVDLDLASRVHDPHYVDAIFKISASGGGWIDPDTMCGPDSFLTASLAAGAVVAAVNRALDLPGGRSFVIGRPPGHHATRARGMGFCLLNSVAIAATHALERGLQRVAIIDWDVHHGNGTQDIFYASDRVMFCSLHRYGRAFYPGTGAHSEHGEGRGVGFTLNVPLSAGLRDEEFVRAFDDHVAGQLRAFSPELLLISAGFDAHVRDPLGGMALTEHGFAEMTQRVIGIAADAGNAPIVVALEGGYDLQALGLCVSTVLRVLDTRSPTVYDAW